MPEVRCLPDDVTVTAADGQTLLQALLAAGVPITHACGGNARCSTCRVQIEDGDGECPDRSEAEAAIAERLEFPDTIRLACQAGIHSDATIRRLVLDEEDVALVSELKDAAAEGLSAVGRTGRVAVLFSDINGFTSLSERLPAYDVIHLLNRYHAAVQPVVDENGGCVDNIMGDGLLVLFGTRGGEDAAYQAVRAGLGMIAAADRMSTYVENTYGRPFGVRLGIHFGDVVLGALGCGDGRRETVIGDAVNLASRLEVANKELGTSILVSDDAREQVEGRVRFGRSFDIEVRGKSGTFAVHEVLGLET